MKKILVVDDEEHLCELMKKCLEESGNFSVTTTSSPIEALKICKSQKPDLIILDVVMPEMEGPEVVRTLKKDPSTNNIKIIVTSGGGEMVFDHTQDVLGTNVHVHNCDRCDDWIDLDRQYPYSIEVEGVEK